MKLQPPDKIRLFTRLAAALLKGEAKARAVNPADRALLEGQDATCRWFTCQLPDPPGLTEEYVAGIEQAAEKIDGTCSKCGGAMTYPPTCCPAARLEFEVALANAEAADARPDPGESFEHFTARLAQWLVHNIPPHLRVGVK